ncbi:DUF4838 domain-containing protein [Amnibacterium kyonggiense]|uniref:Uncharacterized protein DUF4838 n=1 Tax=Amnibacterium kyonggiense TaxID=595671 RepID=A0A4R7FKC9_9MICO|nr:DUF4838 domain-containing protein [Amnibacterium kyonggiense]TDS76821.1 uncharacterized protein DUF4838 [Amnibacterium kyonggiense]
MTASGSQHDGASAETGPSFIRRGAVIGSLDLTDHWIDLAVRTGLTTLGLHPLPEVPADDPASVEAMLVRVATPAFRELVLELEDRGLELEFEAHAMRLLLPRSHFDRHPDWFRMDAHGERTPDLNLCPSSTEALEVVEQHAEAIGAQLAPYSRSHRYLLWGDDNGEHCHCDACAELTPSDQALLVSNSILRGLRRADAEATAPYLAYQATSEVPRHVRPEAGIFLEYAPIDRDSRFAMRDTANAKNAAQVRPIAGLLEFFGRDGSQVLEYWLDLSRFFDWQRPFGELPLYRGVLRSDLEFYLRSGFEHVTTFALGLDEQYESTWGEQPVADYGRLLRAARRPRS